MPRKKKAVSDSARELEARFHAALPYYRSRGGVVFISYSRFWERHGFVQQSLAHFLTENRIPVTWLDSAGWRPYEPVVRASSRFLTVRQIRRLPGERIAPIRNLSLRVQVVDIRLALEHHGGNPVVWVQAGLEEGIAEQLPYIDVFSTFDDPYRHRAEDPLCQKARLVICQNRYTESILADIPKEKRTCLWPPIDMRDEVFERLSWQPPAGFPKRAMGYIGTFLHDGFDLFLLEYFIRQLPDWGFVLMGRTDREGLSAVERLKRYRNFFYKPWAERETLSAVWSRLDVSLLLYRNNPTQDGAFPVKVVEGLRFGVPAVGTQVNKTRDLVDSFPCTSFADQLVEMAVKTADMSSEKIAAQFDFFQSATDPRLQIATVAEFLPKRRLR